MKRSFLFLVSLTLLIAVFLERGGFSWELERPLLHWLAKKTDHPLPGVTAVILPMTGELIAPQDVALALRAMLGFHPSLILIAAPMGDLSNGPFSLLREASREGAIQGMNCCFGVFPKQPALYQEASVHLLPRETELTVVAGEVGVPNASGFMLPSSNKDDAPVMPLFGMTSHGEIVSSLWWRALEAYEKNKNSIKPVFLLGKRMLVLCNKNVIWLGSRSCLIQKKVPSAKMISLEDVLLLREEMERGEMRPELEMLFRDRTVILGGEEAIAQAALLQDAEQQMGINHLNAPIYGLLLVMLTMGMMIALRFSEIDFWFFLFFLIVVYAFSTFIVFNFLELLMPLVMPSSIMIIALLKREWGQTRNSSRNPV
ncbi:MAG: hypothetical protein QE493_02795 [Verrucomicrobiae bacterium]|jgi:hypothetical protein|nr:hypothetical protein [Verrucomicrobiae bacterium]